MGKRTLNPMDDFHRQKRKKDIAKNKSTRISARDDRVKETKTVSEVAQAIKVLEKRGAKTPGEQQKLQRLQKELKLVNDEASKPKEFLPIVVPQRLTELDDPRKSIYHDETMNPYGAPPPGKPRLYHRRGGGQTMDISEAVVPGEEQHLPIMGDPPPQEQHRQQHSLNPQQRSYLKIPRGQHAKNPQKQQKCPQRHLAPPPPPPPPKDMLSSIPPPLPTPSSAVLRTRRRTGLAVDIWASTEEVVYERNIMCNDLEDANHSSGWWYRDTAHILQGPYGKEQIQAWSRCGFFPPNTPVRQGDNGKWWTFGDVDWETGEIKTPLATQRVGINERISALRQKQSIPSINAVDEVSSSGDTHKQQLLSPQDIEQDIDEDDDDNDTSVFARIEALKQLHKIPDFKENEAISCKKDINTEGKPLRDEDDGDEIAVLQPWHQSSEADCEVNVRKSENRGTEYEVSVISSHPVQTETTDYSMEDSKSSAAGTNECDDTAPSHDFFLTATVEPLGYPIDEPALYPAGEDLTYPAGEDLTYPAGEDLTYPAGEDLAYPAGEDHAYPVGDDLTYPVSEDLAYPAGDDLINPDGEGLAYPVNGDSTNYYKHTTSTDETSLEENASAITGAFIVDSKRDLRNRDQDNGLNVETTLVPPTKANLLVVAGLVPSHVQKSRKSRTRSKLNVTQKLKLPPGAEGGKEVSKSAVNDYEKFMLEISSLK